jgi:hypothetical protein
MIKAEDSTINFSGTALDIVIEFLGIIDAMHKKHRESIDIISSLMKKDESMKKVVKNLELIKKLFKNWTNGEEITKETKEED